MSRGRDIHGGLSVTRPSDDGERAGFLRKNEACHKYLSLRRMCHYSLTVMRKKMCSLIETNLNVGHV